MDSCEQYRQELRTWLAEHQTDKTGRIEIVNKLIEMDPLGWRAVEWAGLPASWLLGQAFMADFMAKSDILYYQSKAEQKRALRAVQRKARELLAALQGARVLDKSSPLIDTEAETIAASWTRRRASAQEGCDQPFAHISLPFLLDHLRDKCQELIENPPTRAVTKVRKGGESRAYVLAFVRWLHWMVVSEGRCRGATKEEVNDTVRHTSRAVLGCGPELVPDDLYEMVRYSPFRDPPG